MIPSNMENKKKRVVAQNIENKRGKTFNDYSDEFEYLISAGMCLQKTRIIRLKRRSLYPTKGVLAGKER